MIASMTPMPAGISEQIAEEALRCALGNRCRGGSWRGLARGLAWHVVIADKRNPKSIELMADAAEAVFGTMIDDALWAVERVVIESWHEFLELRPGDVTGALTAMRLDASEESARLLDSVCERVLDALRASSRRAA